MNDKHEVMIKNAMLYVEMEDGDNIYYVMGDFDVNVRGEFKFVKGEITKTYYHTPLRNRMRNWYNEMREMRDARRRGE